MHNELAHLKLAAAHKRLLLALAVTHTAHLEVLFQCLLGLLASFAGTGGSSGDGDGGAAGSEAALNHVVDALQQCAQAGREQREAEDEAAVAAAAAEAAATGDKETELHALALGFPTEAASKLAAALERCMDVVSPSPMGMQTGSCARPAPAVAGFHSYNVVYSAQQVRVWREYEDAVYARFTQLPALWRVLAAVADASRPRARVFCVAPELQNVLRCVLGALARLWQSRTSRHSVAELVAGGGDAALARALQESDAAVEAGVRCGLVQRPLASIGLLLPLLPPRAVASLLACVADAVQTGNERLRYEGQCATKQSPAGNARADVEWARGRAATVVRAVMFENVERVGHLWSHFVDVSPPPLPEAPPRVRSVKYSPPR